MQLSRNRLLDSNGFCVVMVVWEARCENVPPLTWNGEGPVKGVYGTDQYCTQL